jgi:hypothetical protein
MKELIRMYSSRSDKIMIFLSVKFGQTMLLTLIGSTPTLLLGGNKNLVTSIVILNLMVFGKT